MPFKKILIILIAVLVLVVGVLIVYTFFLKKEAPAEPVTPSPTTTPTPAPKPKPYRISPIQAISEEPVLDYTIDGQKIKYYSATNGNVFQSNFDGSQLIRLSSNILPGLLKTLWSPNKDQVIAIFEDKGQIKKYLYDYQSEKSTLLNKNIRHIAWSPIEAEIAYQYYDPQTEDNNISIANPDGSQWENIFATRMKDLIVEWPSSEQISIRTKPSGLAQSVVYIINPATGDFQKVLDQTNGLTVLWSPLGDKLLFSATDGEGKNLRLKIADLDEQTIKEFDFVTLPEKCIWSQDNRTLFCAIPEAISPLAILPDDHYKGLVSFDDEFWRINLDTQEKIQIFGREYEEELAYDAAKLLLPPQEDYLFFVNKKDGLLYSLEL